MCVILQQERPPNPLTVFSLPLGIAFLFVSYTMSELPSELQGRDGENCNHSILFTIRIPCLFYGSNFSQVNWVDTISHPLDAPKAGIRDLETIQRSHLLPSRYVSRDMATKEPYVICSWHANSGCPDNVTSTFPSSLRCSGLLS